MEKLLFHKNNKQTMTLYPEGSDIEILIACLESEAREEEGRDEEREQERQEQVYERQREVL